MSLTVVKEPLAISCSLNKRLSSSLLGILRFQWQATEVQAELNWVLWRTSLPPCAFSGSPYFDEAWSDLSDKALASSSTLSELQDPNGITHVEAMRLKLKELSGHDPRKESFPSGGALFRGGRSAKNCGTKHCVQHATSAESSLMAIHLCDLQV